MNNDDAARLGAPLVLTEWKVADSERDAIAKVAQADAQIERYGTGALGAVELRRTRFVIVVTGKHVSLPVDQERVRLRRFNVAVSPLTPSKQRVPRHR